MATQPKACPPNVFNRTALVEALLADRPQWVHDFIEFLFDPTIPSFVCMNHIPDGADKPNDDSLTVTEDFLFCLLSDAFNCKTLDQLHTTLEIYAPLEQLRGVCNDPAELPLYPWGRVWAELMTKDISSYTPDTRISVDCYDDFIPLSDEILDQGLSCRQMWEMLVAELFPHSLEDGGKFEGRTIPKSLEEAKRMYNK